MEVFWQTLPQYHGMVRYLRQKQSWPRPVIALRFGFLPWLYWKLDPQFDERGISLVDWERMKQEFGRPILWAPNTTSDVMEAFCFGSKRHGNRKVWIRKGDGRLFVYSRSPLTWRLIFLVRKLDSSVGRLKSRLTQKEK